MIENIQQRSFCLWIGLVYLLFSGMSPAKLNAVDFSVILKAEGTERCLINPTAEERDDGFPRLEERGGIIAGRPCAEETRTVCVPQNCQLDSSRTYSTPTHLGGNFGRGGPGYGIVVQSVNSPGGGEFAEHTWNAGTQCLTSRVRVCAKRRQRGWYEARHVLYLTCGIVEQQWQNSQQKGPFTLTPSAGYKQLSTYNGALGSGGSCTTTQVGRYDVEVTSKIPSTADLQVGMFAQSPLNSSENGPRLWAKNSADNDLMITALEVTQGIQNFANEMPLVAGRRTVVRVHVQSVLNVGSVQARLRAFRNGSEIPLSPLAPENLINVSTTGGDRLRLDHSYLFRLPPAWRNGVVTLHAEVDSSEAIPETNEGNNIREETVRFHPVRDLWLTTVPFHLHPDGDRDQPSLIYRKADRTFWPIASNLLRFFPIRRILLNDCGLSPQKPSLHGFPFHQEWNLSKGINQAFILSRVMWLRGLNSCGPSSQHWVGMVHPEINTTTNSGETLGIAIPFGRSSWVKMDAASSALIPWRIDGGTTFAHELGHNQGLLHVRCAGNEGFPVNSAYPHPEPNCRLAEGEQGYFGFDVYNDNWQLPESTVISNDPAANHPHAAFPLMGYRAPEWTSPFSYCFLLLREGIFCNPLMMRQLFSSEEFAETVNSPVDQGPPAASVKHKIDQPQPPAENKRDAVRNYLLIGGVIDVSNRSAEDFTVYKVPKLPPNLAVSDSERPFEVPDWTLVQIDALGRELNSRSLSFELIDSTEPFYPFLEALPMDPLTACVEVRFLETVVARRVASPSPPIVRLLEPTGGAITAPLKVKWLGYDPDGDPLRFALYYSADDGKTWRLVAWDLEEREYDFRSLRSLPGSQKGRFRIEAHDGFHTSTDSTDAALTVPNSPPRAAILEADSLHAEPGQTVQLTGVASDIEDGPIIKNSRFSWHSDRDGNLGQGLELYTRTLSRGIHRITLTVTDSTGKVSDDQRLVFIGIEPPQGIWTRWLNRDRPSGVGDYETHSDFARQGQVCAHPIGIECRTTQGGVDWRDAGQTYRCEPQIGGVCRNDNQGEGNRCVDYEVRFLCLPGSLP